ncbi:MAG: prepilin-type N-terminal cleavage/methylation domain-containing protein [bacterium]
MRTPLQARRGFTLIEIMISMLLLLFITGAAVQFLRKQTGLVSRETSRMDAMQNAQFAASQIERELREAGAGASDQQPMIVQLDSMAITFNANMVSVDTGDVRAVYQLRDADTNAARTMLKSERMALPNSSPVVNYPDSTYFWASGVQSGAETISYYLRPDSTTSLSQRYLLFRRVNALPATLIARSIVKNTLDTMPFFTYYKTDTLNHLIAIAKNKFPMYHVMIHGAVDDTGKSAQTDSIRAVRLHFLTASRDYRTGKDNLRTVETLVRLMNAGLLHSTSCGQPPIATATPVATSSVAAAPIKSVTITWTASTDDATGEADIERYAIFRRLSTQTSFGDPISSIPASKAASYSFNDRAVVASNVYVYGIAAQDCTPNLSAVTASAAVTVLP